MSKLKIGDVVRVLPAFRRRLWVNKTGRIVFIQERPYGYLVDVEFEGGEVRTFSASGLRKEDGEV